MTIDPGFNYEFESPKNNPLFADIHDKTPAMPNRHHRRAFFRMFTGRNAPCGCGGTHREMHTGHIVLNKRKDCPKCVVTPRIVQARP